MWLSLLYVINSIYMVMHCSILFQQPHNSAQSETLPPPNALASVHVQTRRRVRPTLALFRLQSDPLGSGARRRGGSPSDRDCDNPNRIRHLALLESEEGTIRHYGMKRLNAFWSLFFCGLVALRCFFNFCFVLLESWWRLSSAMI